MRNHPLYATEAGGKRVDVVARAICRTGEQPFCMNPCATECQATDDDLENSGVFDAACAAIVAVDRYDDALRPTPAGIGFITEEMITAAAKESCCPDGDCVPHAPYCAIAHSRNWISKMLKAALKAPAGRVLTQNEIKAAAVAIRIALAPLICELISISAKEADAGFVAKLFLNSDAKGDAVIVRMNDVIARAILALGPATIEEVK